MFRRYLEPNEKGWNGFMQNLTKRNKHFEVSAINFLPFIHASPFQFNTLYAALSLAISQAQKFDMETCVLTLNQPLYSKLRGDRCLKIVQSYIGCNKTWWFPHDNILFRKYRLHYERQRARRGIGDNICRKYWKTDFKWLSICTSCKSPFSCTFGFSKKKIFLE